MKSLLTCGFKYNPKVIQNVSIYKTYLASKYKDFLEPLGSSRVPKKISAKSKGYYFLVFKLKVR